MTDVRQDPALPDHERIDLAGEHEVRMWTQTLGVGEAELREAIDAVGNSAPKVREYLKVP